MNEKPYEKEWLEAWTERWPEFMPEEIYSPASIVALRHKLCPQSMDLLVGFRHWLGKPVIVNRHANIHRGVRSAAENGKIKGGAPDSMHVCGRAFDINVPGLQPAAVEALVRQFGHFYGIGLYATWLHIDTRWSPTGSITYWRGPVE